LSGTPPADAEGVTRGLDGAFDAAKAAYASLPEEAEVSFRSRIETTIASNPEDLQRAFWAEVQARFDSGTGNTADCVSEGFLPRSSVMRANLKRPSAEKISQTRRTGKDIWN